MLSDSPCPCGNDVPYSRCCQPYHVNKQIAPTAEALMRSRFSAYVVKDYEYILRTYAPQQRADLSLADITTDAEHTQWLTLEVIAHKPALASAQVEFKAYYQIDKQFYVMHERSDFELVDDRWFYTTGTMLPDTGELKPKRNDPCPCHSGKKFKKCCGG